MSRHAHRTREQERDRKRRQRLRWAAQGLNAYGHPYSRPWQNPHNHPPDCICFDCLWGHPVHLAPLVYHVATATRHH